MYDVGCCPLKDGLNFEDVNNNDCNETLQLYDSYFINNSSLWNRGILASLLLRARFGGMRGDMLMLTQAAETWKRRFLSDTVSHKSAWLIAIESAFKKLTNDSKEVILKTYGSITWHNLLQKLFISSSIRFLKSPVSSLYVLKFNNLNFSFIFSLNICESDLVLSAIDFHCSDMVFFSNIILFSQ